MIDRSITAPVNVCTTQSVLRSTIAIINQPIVFDVAFLTTVAISPFFGVCDCLAWIAIASRAGAGNGALWPQAHTHQIKCFGMCDKRLPPDLSRGYMCEV